MGTRRVKDFPRDGKWKGLTQLLDNKMKSNKKNIWIIQVSPTAIFGLNNRFSRSKSSNIENGKIKGLELHPTMESQDYVITKSITYHQHS